MLQKKPTEIERRGLTVQEFAHATGLGRTTVFGMIAAGKIKSSKIGKSRRIHISEVDRLLSGDVA
ncbi:MAG: helix-turn-helix domain-containing protein [Rhodospirillales bacterium]